jgi:tripartite-type tricarboxylate transporter receptor subunit TctC
MKAARAGGGSGGTGPGRPVTGRMIAGALAAAAMTAAGPAVAQAWPAKSIRMIVPFSPGGATDVVARILAPRLTEALGQPVVVDNRPGGATAIGIDLVAKAPPDGYTVGVANISFGANPSLLSKLPYDSERDLLPVTLMSKVPMVLSVHPSVPAQSVKALVALARSKPGALTYASAGQASANHLATEQFSFLAGVKMVHVPYKGGGQAVLSIVSGETGVLFATIPSSIQHLKGGRLIGLGVSTATRDPTMPDLPTVAESGLPGFDVYDWHGLVLPAGTPPAIAGRLQQEMQKALASADMRERLAGVGALPIGGTPAAFQAFLREQFTTWAKVVKEAGIRIE